MALWQSGHVLTVFTAKCSCCPDEWPAADPRRAVPQVEVFVNGALVEGFSREFAWGAVSQPPRAAVLVEVPSLHLEVSLHPLSGQLTIELPSKIYGGSVGGVCGKWATSKAEQRQIANSGTRMDNHGHFVMIMSSSDYSDSSLSDRCRCGPVRRWDNCPVCEPLRPPPGNCDGDAADEASRPPAFWLLEHESADECVSEPPPCVPPPADRDPCQRLLNQTVFGVCHPLHDPAPLLRACQRKL